jgi:ketosteroid isomerase-like protein
MLVGDRPRRRRGRAAARYGALLLAVAGIAFVAAQIAGAGGGTDPDTLPGASVSDGEVEELVSRFSDAYASEDAVALGRLLTRDAQRVVPGARQSGRAEVVRSYKRQFADSETRSFEVEDLRAAGGATGRASGRYVATYDGEPDVTGTITFGVLRDRGTPRIALISARQDPPAAQ